MDERLLNRFGAARIGARQVDELIGIARGLLADGKLVHESPAKAHLRLFELYQAIGAAHLGPDEGDD